METLPADENKLHNPLSASFDAESGIILVNINKIDYGFIDQPVKYEGKIFQPKNELHITVISQDAAERLHSYLESHPDNLPLVTDLVHSTKWSFRKKGEFYYVEEEPGVETIIQMVDVVSMDAFLSSLSSIVGKGFVMPPTHVTLYTRGTVKGIGLPNQETFRERVKAAVKFEEIHPEEDGPAGPVPGPGSAR